MAFDPGNPPSLIASGIGGSRGLKAWAWRGTDPIADVIAAGYIRTARKLGMGVGDSVRYVDGNDDAHHLVLASIDADTGYGTVAFPQTSEEAFAIDASPSGEIYVVAYVDGVPVRVDPATLPAGVLTFASQAEAEAGSATDKPLNALRVFQGIAAYITGRAAKTPPVDADGILITDSAAAGAPKQVTWANIKAAMFTAWGALLTAGTDKATPVDADVVLLSDSAASNATKKLTWANIKATLTASTMFASNIFRLRDNSDPTKILAFDLSDITTGTTKTLKIKGVTRQIITAAGAGTYNTPAGCTKILVQLQAAGGGGGYAKPGAAQAAVGGGGGGGAYTEKLIDAPAASYSYSLGAAGAGGVAATSTAATDAAASTFGSTVLGCAGGAAGGSSSSTTTLGASALGGAGGAVSTAGDIQVNGGKGERGVVFSGTICFGGAGGDAHLGTIMQGDVSPSAGAQGRGYGTGGTGAANVNSAEADGGAGAPAILIVTEFYQ